MRPYPSMEADIQQIEPEKNDIPDGSSSTTLSMIPRILEIQNDRSDGIILRLVKKKLKRDKKKLSWN